MLENTACSSACLGGAGGEVKEGISAPKEGPSGQGDRLPHRNGANLAETAPHAKARGAAAPGLTPDPERPGTVGQGGPRLGWQLWGQGPLSTRLPRKSRRDLVSMELSSQASRSPDPECRAGTLSLGGGSSSRPPLHQHAAGFFCCGRLWRFGGAYQAARGGGVKMRGLLTLSGGGNCS